QVDGNVVDGTWQSSFTGAVVTGVVEGVADDLILLQLIPDALPECPYSVVGEKEGAKLTGTYASCIPGIGGTFSLTKQRGSTSRRADGARAIDTHRRAWVSYRSLGRQERRSRASGTARQNRWREPYQTRDRSMVEPEDVAGNAEP